MLRGDEEKQGGRGRDRGLTGGTGDRGHRISGGSGERARGSNSGNDSMTTMRRGRVGGVTVEMSMTDPDGQ